MRAMRRQTEEIRGLWEKKMFNVLKVIATATARDNVEKRLIGIGATHDGGWEVSAGFAHGDVDDWGKNLNWNLMQQQGET